MRDAPEARGGVRARLVSSELLFHSTVTVHGPAGEWLVLPANRPVFSDRRHPNHGLVPLPCRAGRRGQSPVNGYTPPTSAPETEN